VIKFYGGGLFAGLLMMASVASSAAEVCLFDEEGDFSGKLFRSSGPSVAQVVEGDAVSGKKFLNITPALRGCDFFFHREFVWDYTIAEKPVKNEYRYLLFAWKKNGGSTIQLGLRDDRSDLVVTYYAGEPVEHKPRDKSRDNMKYVQISTAVPGEWQYVIRDMYKDLGGLQADFMINGVYFVAGDGTSADFDCIYLSDDRAALEKLAAQLKKGSAK
jgi:hypothetical protein